MSSPDLCPLTTASEQQQEQYISRFETEEVWIAVDSVSMTTVGHPSALIGQQGTVTIAQHLALTDIAVLDVERQRLEAVHTAQRLVLGMYGPASVYNRVTHVKCNTVSLQVMIVLATQRIRSSLTCYFYAFSGPLAALTSNVSGKHLVRLPDAL